MSNLEESYDVLLAGTGFIVLGSALYGVSAWFLLLALFGVLVHLAVFNNIKKRPKLYNPTDNAWTEFRSGSIEHPSIADYVSGLALTVTGEQSRWESHGGRDFYPQFSNDIRKCHELIVSEIKLHTKGGKSDT